MWLHVVVGAVVGWALLVAALLVAKPDNQTVVQAALVLRDVVRLVGRRRAGQHHRSGQPPQPVLDPLRPLTRQRQQRLVGSCGGHGPGGHRARHTLSRVTYRFEVVGFVVGRMGVVDDHVACGSRCGVAPDLSSYASAIRRAAYSLTVDPSGAGCGRGTPAVW